MTGGASIRSGLSLSGYVRFAKERVKKSDGLAARPAGRPEKVAVAIAIIAHDARARSATRPQARHHALLPDPGLILKPHLHRLRQRARPQHLAHPRPHPNRELRPELRTRNRVPARVLRASRNPAKPLPPKQLANALVRIRHPEGLLDLATNVANTPPNNPVARRIRSRLHPTPHNRQLLLIEKTRTTDATTIPKTRRTLRVVARRPIANRLTIHPRHPTRLRATDALQNQRCHQKTRVLPRVLPRTRKRPQILRRVRRPRDLHRRRHPNPSEPHPQTQHMDHENARNSTPPHGVKPKRVWYYITVTGKPVAIEFLETSPASVETSREPADLRVALQHGNPHATSTQFPRRRQATETSPYDRDMQRMRRICRSFSLRHSILHGMAHPSTERRVR